MTIDMPSVASLKQQAKLLRASLGAQGQTITHAQALESIAQQWGARDWNTLSALAAPVSKSAQGDANMTRYTPGMRVSGRYLGHAFDAKIKAARANANGYWSLTLRFDTPIDVVASDHFSSFRQQVNCTVSPEGRSAQKTSDGMPHIEIAQH